MPVRKMTVMNDGLTPVRSLSPALWQAEPSPALALRSPWRMCQSAVVTDTHKNTIPAWRAGNLKTFWMCAHVSSMFCMNGKWLCLELVTWNDSQLTSNCIRFQPTVRTVQKPRHQRTSPLIIPFIIPRWNWTAVTVNNTHNITERKNIFCVVLGMVLFI